MTTGIQPYDVWGSYRLETLKDVYTMSCIDWGSTLITLYGDSLVKRLGVHVRDWNP